MQSNYLKDDVKISYKHKRQRKKKNVIMDPKETEFNIKKKNVYELKEEGTQTLKDKKDIIKLKRNASDLNYRQLSKIKYKQGMSFINSINDSENNPKNKIGERYLSKSILNISERYKKRNNTTLPQITNFYTNATNYNNKETKKIKKNKIKNNQIYSIYSTLAKERVDFYSTLSMKKFSSNKNFLKTDNISPLLSKNSNSVKKIITYPKDRHIVILNDQEFGSLAASQRYQKNMEALLDLKWHITEIEKEQVKEKDKDKENDKDKDKDKEKEKASGLIISFLMSNGIFEHKVFEEKMIGNFRNFLFSNFDIDPNIQFKNVLLNALNGKWNKRSLKDKRRINNHSDHSNSSYYKKNNIKHNTVYNSNNGFDIKTNLLFQNKGNNEKEMLKRHFDLIKKPQELIRNLEKDLGGLNCLEIDDSNDIALYSNVINVKKKGRLLEMICLNKAKKQLELGKSLGVYEEVK